MMKQVLRQRLQQKLTPQQILLMKLIQLPAQELEMRLKKELEENPVLDDPGISDETSEEVENERDEKEEELDATEAELLKTDDDDYPGPPSSYEQHDPFFSLVETHTLKEDLHEQISMKLRNLEELAIADYLIGSLDDAGYLRRDTGSIVDDLAFLQGIDTNDQKVEEVLAMLQELEPAGVGARNLQECLVLQARRKNGHDLVSQNALYVLENLFEDFTHRRYEKIVEKTGVSESDLKLVIDHIQDLNPKPGESSSATGESSIAVIPDFNLLVTGDELSISLTNSSLPELKINKSYVEMLENFERKKEKSQRETIKFIKEKVDSARYFIEALKQREETLLKTMETIVVLQRDFFLTGDDKLIKPMILKDIAESIEMDVSTVSRVVNSKYIQTPYGIFSLKKFFSESFTKDSGEEVSTIEVKQLLKSIIEKEDSTEPLNDEELSKLLSDKGYTVARRTVAKYREQLGFAVARMRRKL
ncbi:MAG: RNA polymerase factor sigma-54 [Vicingaceae bacterium]